jgi:hypothetical protein
VAAADTAAWLDRVESLISIGPWLDRATACINGPPATGLPLPGIDPVRSRLALLGIDAAVVAGPTWQFRWTTGACEPIAFPDSSLSPAAN